MKAAYEWPSHLAICFAFIPAAKSLDLHLLAKLAVEVPLPRNWERV